MLECCVGRNRLRPTVRTNVNKESVHTRLSPQEATVPLAKRKRVCLSPVATLVTFLGESRVKASRERRSPKPS